MKADGARVKYKAHNNHIRFTVERYCIVLVHSVSMQQEENILFGIPFDCDAGIFIVSRTH